MEPIELCGSIRAGASSGFFHAEPPQVEAYPVGTRIVLGIVVDPNQPDTFAPFTLIERPTDAGWRTETWQSPELQGGRAPQEAAGNDDPDRPDFLLRQLTLLGMDELLALSTEPTQPFRRDR